MQSNDALRNESEAVRQLGICNSCRYCEGYCATFGALTRYRQLDLPTIDHLANLCHNCRGCYYACQYTEPHEFAINIPALLATRRADNWQQYVKPQWMSRLLQQQVWPYIALTVIFILLFTVIMGIPFLSADPFYTAISHSAMVLIFTPLFVLPFIGLVTGVRSYWRSTGGQRLTYREIKHAFASVVSMRQLSGGQDQGCNYESGERYSMKRRWAHQATLYGFLLCFASTSTGTLYHYLLDLPAPYPFFSVPKLLGVVGGMLLSTGTAAMFWLKRQADPKLGHQTKPPIDYLFIVLLFLVSTTGLLLYFFSGTASASFWLIIHLALVATFFVSIPYSKMVHGFFRLAALCRESQLKHINNYSE